MTCTPSALVAAAVCYAARMSRDDLSAANVYLACQWASVGMTDPDAQAFITAAGITDATQMAAINTFVKDLKGNGTPSFWSREEIIYPMIGGTYASTRVNLKSPGTYDFIETVGSEPDYSLSGVQGNFARTAFLRTGYLIPPARATNLRIFHYLDAEASGDFDYYWGATQVFNQVGSQHTNPPAGEVRYNLNDGTATIPFAAGVVLGGYCFQRATATPTVKQAGQAGAAFVNTVVAIVGIPAFELYLLADDANNAPFEPCDARLSGWSLGDPFASDAEWAAYYAIWQTFQTALGRNH